MSEKPTSQPLPAPARISGTRQVCVRMSQAEYEQISAFAAEHQLSVPELLRLSWHALHRAEELVRG